LNFPSLKPTGRIDSIDVLRALTMYFMLFVNDLWTLHDIPEWLGHVPPGVDGMGFADIIFPLFMFVVGLSIPFAISSRRNKGHNSLQISVHILSRTLALVAMGFFMVNLENINQEILPISKYIWQILMALAFVLIWNIYQKRTYWDKLPHWIPKIIGILLLVYLAYIYKSGPNDSPTWMEPRWWGILGLIGWAYLLSAFVFLLGGQSLIMIALVWLFLHFLHLADLVDPLSTFSIPLVVGKSNHICVMSGVLASSIYLKFGKEKGSSGFLAALFVLALVTIGYGFFLRPYWGIAKIGGTPSWTDICCGIGFSSFAILYLIVDLFKFKGWTGIFAPAGRSTLTTYLVPYFYYAILGLTVIYLPESLRAGYVGVVKSLLYSFLVIGITRLFEMSHIRLRI